MCNYPVKVSFLQFHHFECDGINNGMNILDLLINKTHYNLFVSLSVITWILAQLLSIVSSIPLPPTHNVKLTDNCFQSQTDVAQGKTYFDSLRMYIIYIFFYTIHLKYQYLLFVYSKQHILLFKLHYCLIWKPKGHITNKAPYHVFNHCCKWNLYINACKCHSQNVLECSSFPWCVPRKNSC